MPFPVVASVLAAMSTAKSRFFTLFLTGLLGWVAAAAVIFLWALPVLTASRSSSPDDMYAGLGALVNALPALAAAVFFVGLSAMAQYAVLGGDVRGAPLNPIQAWVRAITRLPHLLCATIPFTLVSLVVLALPIFAVEAMDLHPGLALVVVVPGIAFLCAMMLPLPFLAITDGRWFSSFTMAWRIVAEAFFPILGGLLLLTVVMVVLSFFIGAFVGLGLVVLMMGFPEMGGVANVVIALTQLLVGLYTSYATMAYAACVFERVIVVENAAKT